MKNLRISILLIIAVVSFLTPCKAEEIDYVALSKELRAERLKMQDDLLRLSATNTEPDPNYVRTYLMKYVSGEANCIYMLDDYAGITDLSGTFWQTYIQYSHLFDDETKEVLEAYGNKLEAMRLYGNIDSYDTYYNAVYYYTLCLKPFAAIGKRDVILQELAQLSYKRGCQTSDIKYFNDSEYYLNQLPDSPLMQSQRAMVNARKGETNTDYAKAQENFNVALSEIGKALAATKKGTAEYAEMMRKKGKILSLMYKKLGGDRRAEALQCFNYFIDFQKKHISILQKKLTDSQQRQAWMALHQFLYDCTRLGDFAPAEIYDLALYTKGYLLQPLEKRTQKSPKWSDVAKQLTDKECAVEFVVCDDDLMAFMIDKNSKKPQCFTLAKVSELMNKYLGKSGMQLSECLASSNGYLKNYIYEDSELPSMIWTPQLMQAIKGKDRIYFSPDGFLHQLAIEYMIPDDNIIGVRLSSTRRLLDKPTKISPTDRALICGGIDYYVPANEQDNMSTKNNDIYAYYNISPFVNDSISFLPGSKKEIVNIAATRNFAGDKIVQSNQGTEAYLTKAMPDYDILHFSTHGCFVGATSDGTDLKPVISDTPLSNCALFVSGCGTNFFDRNFDPEKLDGLISGSELASLKLDKVKMAVLSACQTGVGYVTADGLYGMQRGLQMAGVDAMVVSLWSVSDESTTLLMSYFYEELKKGDCSAHDAFLRAQKRLAETEEIVSYGLNPSSLTNAPRVVKYSTPYHTNAFITIDLF